MNRILFKYLLSGFFKSIFKVLILFYCFGIILNLFEEIEFFKNLETSIFFPISMTTLYIPNMMFKLLPFIIFISSMWFLLNLRNSTDLLSLKVFGYSNFKILCILGLSSFIFGWIVLFAINPFTSVMVKYYEQTKSNYSKDIDHLIGINKNGLWIKENTLEGHRIITADQTKNYILKNITIFNLDQNYNINEEIKSKSANISSNEWVLKDVTIKKLKDGIFVEKLAKDYSIKSKYDYQKIGKLFKNFDTMSFLDLILKYEDLQNGGYSKSLLDQNLNSMLSMPFFLFIMTALASILTMNALKKSNNFTFIITGLIVCVIIFYFKDLSLALGQTNRIPLFLASWVPVVVLGLFSSIGVLQINEK
tara:strand:+ start:1824 stop:2912 length:1089 start_codon:yes stop_codon:yes gene_type:complete